MKKSTIILLIILVFFLLCLGAVCFVNKDGSGTNVPVISKVDPVKEFYSQKDTWDVLTEDASGAFQTGYYFIDIDLDGNKELAVQLGGDDTRNCITKFYQLKDKKVIPMKGFGEDYSFAISNIQKYQDENGDECFINQYTVKRNDTQYESFYDKITNNFNVQTLYSIIDTYDDGMKSEFFVKGNATPREEYTNDYKDFYATLTPMDLMTYFIPYSDWKNASEDSQKEMLTDSYYVSKQNYAEAIEENIIKSIDLSQYQALDIALSNAVYGSELDAVKEHFGGLINAQVYTDGKTFIEIIPAPDALDNMIYYYQNGKLVAYVREFNGIGGQVTYYFQNDALQSIDKTQIEPEMEFTPEDGIAILIKAESAWAEYSK